MVVTRGYCFDYGIIILCFGGNLDYGSNSILARQNTGSNLEQSEYGYKRKKVVGWMV